MSKKRSSRTSPRGVDGAKHVREAVRPLRRFAAEADVRVLRLVPARIDFADAPRVAVVKRGTAVGCEVRPLDLRAARVEDGGRPGIRPVLVERCDGRPRYIEERALRLVAARVDDHRDARITLSPRERRLARDVEVRLLDEVPVRVVLRAPPGRAVRRARRRTARGKIRLFDAIVPLVVAPGDARVARFDRDEVPVDPEVALFRLAPAVVELRFASRVAVDDQRRAVGAEVRLHRRGARRRRTRTSRASSFASMERRCVAVGREVARVSMSWPRASNLCASSAKPPALMRRLSVDAEVRAVLDVLCRRPTGARDAPPP